MKDLSLYIHIPFCESKCPYCDFYSVSDKTSYDEYTDKLCDMIKLYAKGYNRNLCTVYFGGGTPSVLETDRIVKILTTIKENFTVNSDAEITIEINPCTGKLLDFNKLRECGFNRLSIGLQSADSNELKTLGRRHRSDDVKDVIKLAREAKFENISLDLILCVPGQTKKSLTESIKFCKDCDVEHISAYILKIEKNTKFYEIRDTLNLFDEDKEASQYLHTVNTLEECGYEQYEISNFSKPTYEGKHNLRYWKDCEYLGLGPSAHSFVDNKRFYFSRNIENFYKNKTFNDGVGGDINEYIMLALRLKEGLSISNLSERYQYTKSDRLIKALEKLRNEKLLEFDGDKVSLTASGFLVSNSIINFILNSL